MHCTSTRAMSLALMTFIAGCQGPENKTPKQRVSGVALSALATVRLKDRDTAYIGKTNALAVSTNGEFFVTDMLSRRVLRFDSDGAFVEAIGRGGGGPNEFEGPSWLTSLDDSTLAVIDMIRRQAVLWDLPSKTARTRLPLPGLTSAVVYSDGSLYAASADVERGTARHSLAQSAGSTGTLGPSAGCVSRPLLAHLGIRLDCCLW